MPSVREAVRRRRGSPEGFAPIGPVLLATLSVRVALEAEEMAIDSALQAGVSLILANLLTFRPGRLTSVLAREYAILPHEEDLDAVRETAARAADRGVATELLRISSPHPVKAMLELAEERQVGLLVFGPERSRLPRWRFRRAARAIRRQAPCLVWISSE
ncbi:MAG TPA: universal stress protein [Solirubrobacteraceae bacterium]|jgi:nucleotide-binding universal stress UspA family protein|nr:universal stress protein [Solirubrobacteraceae bacterium]